MVRASISQLGSILDRVRPNYFKSWYSQLPCLMFSTKRDSVKIGRQAGMWKRKRLNFLWKQKLKVEAVKFLWKRKLLKKEAGSGSKNILLLPSPCWQVHCIVVSLG